jgi:lipid II:glycine glycyltransferase (peptidoglycan interpeptide bridge formation enzyme)
MEEILKKKGFRKEPKKFQFILELLSEDKMFENFNRITRKGIKKAQKSNLTIKEIDREEELEKFYQLYLKNMKSFGTPQHAYNYFRNFMMMGKDFFKGLNCYREEKLIGSLIVFYNKTYMYAAYNFSDYKSLVYQPNDLLYWEMIRWASNHNISYFDFGQCEPDAEDGSHASGIYKFKSKWGGKLYKKSYFYYSFENEEKKSNKKSEYKKMIRVWRRLPLWIIKFIGPKIASQLAL